MCWQALQLDQPQLSWTTFGYQGQRQTNGSTFYPGDPAEGVCTPTMDSH